MIVFLEKQWFELGVLLLPKAFL